MTTATTVTSEINAHIRSRGGSYSAWYVGIASKPRDRLFVDHNVREQGDVWIFRDAGSATAARQIERHFLALGCKGGGGGGDNGTRFVYAYKIRPHTQE